MYRTKQNRSSLFPPSLHTMSCIPSRSCFNSCVSPLWAHMLLFWISNYSGTFDWDGSVFWWNQTCFVCLEELSIWHFLLETTRCRVWRLEVRVRSVCVSLCLSVLSKKSQSWCTLYLLPFGLMSIWTVAVLPKQLKEKGKGSLMEDWSRTEQGCVGSGLSWHCTAWGTHTYHLPTCSLTSYFTLVVCGCVFIHVWWEPKSIHSVLVELPNT